MTKKKRQADLSDWVALAINVVYTYHAFIADTEYGTDAQRDFVAYFTAAMLILSISLASMLTDESIMRAHRMPRAFSGAGQVLMVAQLLLFAYSAHFWLFVMRIVGVAVMWLRFRIARERTEATTNTG